MKLTSFYSLKKPEGADVVNVDDFNDNFEKIDTTMHTLQENTGDMSNGKVFASITSERSNVASGETLATMIGKVMRWFKDLKGAAFVDVANNDNTTAEGYAADARIVKTHGDEIDAVVKTANAANEATQSLNTQLAALKTNCENSASNLSGKIAANSQSISSLNSNLANVSNSLSSQISQTDKINLYVGSDGKLHWVNKAGADSALNFSSGFPLMRFGKLASGQTPSGADLYSSYCVLDISTASEIKIVRSGSNNSFPYTLSNALPSGPSSNAEVTSYVAEGATEKNVLTQGYKYLTLYSRQEWTWGMLYVERVS